MAGIGESMKECLYVYKIESGYVFVGAFLHLSLHTHICVSGFCSSCGIIFLFEGLL